MDNIKKRFSLFLAVLMLVIAIPIGEIVAYGEENKPLINNIEVVRYFKPGSFNQVEKSQIVIIGENLDMLKGVAAFTANGAVDLERLAGSTNNYLIYDYNGKEAITRLIIDKEYSLPSLPQITGLEPGNIVNSGEDIKISGKGFEKEGTKFYGPDGNPLISDYIDVDDNSIELKIGETIVSGNYRLELFEEKEESESTKIVVKNNYPKIFTLRGKLNVSDDIYLIPNQGVAGSEAELRGSRLMEDMSVFLMPIGEHKFDRDYLAEKIGKIREENNEMIYKFKVPEDLKAGTYEVVLTNQVDSTKPIDQQVDSVHFFEKNIYTIIEAGNAAKIRSVNPKKGPDTGLDVRINGKYLGYISNAVFERYKNDEEDIELGKLGKTDLLVKYGDKDKEDVIGVYKPIMGEPSGGKEEITNPESGEKDRLGNPLEVKAIERKITIFIGNKVIFKDIVNITDASDIFDVTIPSISLDEGEDPNKDVIAEIETKIYPGGKDIGRDEIIVRERAEWDEKFLFEKSTYQPEITHIVPENIPVHTNGKIEEDMTVYIYGKNFVKHRFKKDKKDENNKGDEEYIIKMPALNFNGEFILDPNIKKNSDEGGIKRIAVKDNMKIFRDGGEEIDGRDYKLGNKISVTIPKGTDVKDIIPNAVLTLTNPNISNDEVKPGKDPVGLSTTANFNFIAVDSSTTRPFIKSVKPDVFIIDGEEDVVIDGSGFEEDIKLYLDGEEIKEIERIDGGKIIFNAPARPEGSYKLMLQNGNGSFDTHNVKYVRKYTDLEFYDFNPKEGTEGLIVSVTGSDFQRPYDTVVENISNIEKLIGTRVFLGDKEANKYNMKDGKINLVEYKSDDVLFVEDDRVEAVDYYDALIFQKKDSENSNETDDDKQEFYSLNYDPVKGEYSLTDGGNKTYSFYAKEGSVYTDIGSESEEVTTEEGKLTIGGLEFVIKTPYLIENEEIVGKNVWVDNKGELSFKVPELTDAGEYDITLVNPDSTSVSKGKFNYKTRGENIEIDKITPDEGSAKGGNIVTIKIVDKKDLGVFYDGDRKTKVNIGMVEVDPSDVMFIDDHTLRVRMPEYTGEFYGDKRSVIVSVVNFDGGGDSRVDGYTYRRPGAAPFVTGVDPKSGDSAGGQEVSVMGGYYSYKEPIKEDLNKNGKIDDLTTGKVWVGEADGKGGFTKNQIKKDIGELSDDEWTRFVVPILPKVYFGDELAEWDEKSAVRNIKSNAQRIDVSTPRHKGSGRVKVKVVNNDFSESTDEVYYEYIGKNPIINSLDPSTGVREGKRTIIISGRDFVPVDIDVIRNKDTSKQETMPLVQFGKLNGGLQYIGEGPVQTNNKANVSVGNLDVVYDRDEDSLEFTIKDKINPNANDYKFVYESFEENDEEIFLPINLLTRFNGEGNDKELERYDGYEYVRIRMLKDKSIGRDRLEVARGFSPSVKSISDNLIEAQLPSYQGVGKVDVRVINPDDSDGILLDGFEYTSGELKINITDLKDINKISGVKIYDEEIIKARLGQDNIFYIEGTGFRNPMDSIWLQNITRPDQERININLSNVEYNLDETPNNLRITLPEGTFNNNDYPDKYEVFVKVKDGNREGVARSEKKLLQVDLPSGLMIEKIVPNIGPGSGGTEVTITGTGFEPKEGEELKVLFDGREAEIISYDEGKIVVKTPPNKSGVVNVTVEIKGATPSDDRSNTKIDGFTYTSDPRINSVVNPDNDAEVIQNISAKGGEVIKLKGSDFLPGAKVIFKPKLRELKDGEEHENLEANEEIVVINGRRFALSYDNNDVREDSQNAGLEGLMADFKAQDEEGRANNGFAKVLDRENIVVTTPAGKIGDKGILVINPDGGVSNVYNLEYGIPEIGAPFDVRAVLSYDQYVRVSWQGVRNALEYEIYVSEEDGAFEFVGSTKGLTYVYQDLKPNTKYQFMVRAVGQYGESKPLDESKSNYVWTGRTINKPEDKDGPIGEGTEIKREGNDVDVVIGSKDFGMEGLTIDMTQGELAGAKNLTIRIPASLASNDITGRIVVKSTDYNMSFKPAVFKNDLMVKNSLNTKAGVVFKVLEYNGPLGSGQASRMMAGPRYKLEAVNVVNKAETGVGHLAGGIKMNINQNNLLVENRRLRDLGLSRYYAGGNRWIKTAMVDRMAIYTTSGSRR